MWKDETGEVYGSSEDDAEEVAGEAQGNQPRASQSNASACARAGCVHEVRIIRTHAVLRSPDVQALIERIPARASKGMVESVEASEPETQPALEAHGATDGGLVSTCSHLSSLSFGASTRLTQGKSRMR